MRAHKLALVVGAVAGVTSVLAGCSSDSSGSDGPTPSVTTTATTGTDGTTVPGTVLEIGDPAVVKFKADKEHKSQIKLVVSSVKKGKLKDLQHFELNDEARKSSIYYVSTTVKNLGPDALSGAKIVLYGKISKDLVIPPVEFGSTFPTCNYAALPKHFTKGKSARGCMVFLAPKHGKISEIQWRGADNAEPIAWTVR